MALVVHVLDDGGYRRLDGDVARLTEALRDERATIWIDADGHDEKLEALLRDTLGLHALAIEDIFGDRLTPKVEDYGDYLYLVMHGVRHDAVDPEQLGTIELDVVIGKNWVFTHHTLPMRSIDSLTDDLVRNPLAMRRGPAFVAHGLIDRLTDFYLPVVDRFEEEIDELEKRVVEDPTPGLLQHMFLLKRAIQRLRRISVYQREVLQRISRGEFELIPEKAQPFFRDVYDQFVRVSDLADSYRELVSAALQVYMSVTANKTNEIMKVLALISTVMLPLTFIAGIYGMNFEHMPELKWKYGYPVALGMMSVVASLLIWWFKRRRWL
jgi:magnesium transporter